MRLVRAGRVLAAIGVVVGLLAGSCGGGAESEVADVGPSPTALPTFSAEPTAVPETDQDIVEDAVEPTPVEPEDPEATPTPLPTPTPADGGEGDGIEDDGGSADEPDAEPTPDADEDPFCAADVALVEALDALDVADDEDYGEVVALVSEAFAAWRVAAPEDLAAAVDSLTEAWAGIAAIHADTGDPTATDDAVTDWYFSEGFEQAAIAVDDWSTDNCPE